MNISDKSKTLFLNIICIIYIIASIFYDGKGFNLIYMALIPSAITFIFNKNYFNGEILLAIAAILSAFIGNIEISFFIIFYIVMHLYCLKIANRENSKMSEKLIMLISTMILISSAIFAIYNYLKLGPNFFDELNKILSNSKLLSQLNDAINQNARKEIINLNTIDNEMLRVSITSMISVSFISFISLVSLINFSIISIGLNKKNRKIERVKSIWEIRIPKKFCFYILLSLVFSYAFSTGSNGFAYGLFATFFTLGMQVFSIQGIAFIAYLIHNSRVPKILNIPLLVIITMLIIFSGLGGIIIINLGFIDIFFNLRKFSRR